MTKKDYELIAGVFRNTEPNTRWPSMPSAGDLFYLLVIKLANELQDKNRRFDRDKFLRACGVSISEQREQWFSDTHNG